MKYFIRLIKIILLKSISLYWWFIYQSFRNEYEVNKNFKFNGPGILFYGKGRIIIGEGTYLGRYSSIQSVEGSEVKIGKNNQISHYVMIYTQNNVSGQDFSLQRKLTVKGDITIGDNCWIGARVFIKEGITIGDNVVVGANSVVTKNLESNCVYGGVPAKLIKRKELV